MKAEELKRREALLIDAVEADLQKAIEADDTEEKLLLFDELVALIKNCITPDHRKICEDLLSTHPYVTGCVT